MKKSRFFLHKSPKFTITFAELKKKNLLNP